MTTDGREPIEGNAQSFERDTTTVHDSAQHWVSITVRNAQKALQPHTDVIVTKSDGSEILARTDSKGTVHLRRDDLQGAKVRLARHTMEASS